MTTDGNFTRDALEASIRIGAVLILVVWTFWIVRPFVLPAVWGIIIAIAIHPLFSRMSGAMGQRDKLAATLLTLLILVLLVWPCVLLAGLLVENVRDLSAAFQKGSLKIPPPPAQLTSWPLVGKAAYKFWSLASANMEAALAQLQPQLKALGGWLLSGAASTGAGLLQFVLAVIISGFVLARADGGVALARRFAARLAGARGAEFVDLAGATVRGVARGIVGVAAIQALLAGIGMAVAGIPLAGLWALLCVVLAIIQIGIAPVMLGAVIYEFSVADTLPAVLFLAFAVVVGTVDNILKPLLMGRGLDVPMAVILVGSIGGMLASGIVGLFVGAVVLAVAYKIFATWLDAANQEPG
jgi:predicted PurR-regulated permease PerM